MVLLADTKDLSDGLSVESPTFQFGENLLDVSGYTGLLFLKPLQPFDELLEFICSDAARVELSVRHCVLIHSLPPNVSMYLPGNWRNSQVPSFFLSEIAL